MASDPDYAPQDFLPYLLNQAAEACSREFQQYYHKEFGMLWTEWRVLFHLGSYGDMTAKNICHLSSLHKTKVSRAVRALEMKRYLTREALKHDRRNEQLSVTKSGQRTFEHLRQAAQEYDERLTQYLSKDEAQSLRNSLKKLAELAP